MEYLYLMKWIFCRGESTRFANPNTIALKTFWQACRSWSYPGLLSKNTHTTADPLL